MDALFTVAHILLGLLAIPLIMLHKGTGNGLTDSMGSGTANSLASSGFAEKNLRRLTSTLIAGWAAAAVGLALMNAHF